MKNLRIILLTGASEEGRDNFKKMIADAQLDHRSFVFLSPSSGIKEFKKKIWAHNPEGIIIDASLKKKFVDDYCLHAFTMIKQRDNYVFQTKVFLLGKDLKNPGTIFLEDFSTLHEYIDDLKRLQAKPKKSTDMKMEGEIAPEFISVVSK